MSNGLKHLIKISRNKHNFNLQQERELYISELLSSNNDITLDKVIAEQAPYFYRQLQDVADSIIVDAGFLTTIKETLQRLPTSESFQESHFGEIAATMFAEEFLGLKKIYSKLSLLTSQNANAFKMDVLLYKPGSDPLEFVLGEVKSSSKSAADGLPPNHHNSCYSAMFKSLTGYESPDLIFDLAAVKDRLKYIDPIDAASIKHALMPYNDKKITYAGFALIDTATRVDTELKILGTKKSNKVFDIDLICIETYKNVAEQVYSKLKALHDACM